jgi:hypothetical protein
MTAFFSRIVPKRIAGQIALLVITSIVLAHAVAFATIIFALAETRAAGNSLGEACPACLHCQVA